MNGKATHQAGNRVVIVGAGFGGLNAAEALAGAPVRITVIDRKNYHTFQPLLYQVATAGLSPGEIAAPIRSILSRHDNPALAMPTSVMKNGNRSRPASRPSRTRLRFAAAFCWLSNLPSAALPPAKVTIR